MMSEVGNLAGGRTGTLGSSRREIADHLHL